MPVLNATICSQSFAFGGKGEPVVHLFDNTINADFFPSFYTFSGMFLSLAGAPGTPWA